MGFVKTFGESLERRRALSGAFGKLTLELRADPPGLTTSAILAIVPVELDLFGLTSTFAPGELALEDPSGRKGSEPRAAAAASAVELIPWPLSEKDLPWMLPMLNLLVHVGSIDESPWPPSLRLLLWCLLGEDGICANAELSCA